MYEYKPIFGFEDLYSGNFTSLESLATYMASKSKYYRRDEAEQTGFVSYLPVGDRAHVSSDTIGYLAIIHELYQYGLYGLPSVFPTAKTYELLLSTTCETIIRSDTTSGELTSLALKWQTTLLKLNATRLSRKAKPFTAKEFLTSIDTIQCFFRNYFNYGSDMKLKTLMTAHKIYAPPDVSFQETLLLYTLLNWLPVIILFLNKIGTDKQYKMDESVYLAITGAMSDSGANKNWIGVDKTDINNPYYKTQSICAICHKTFRAQGSVKTALTPMDNIVYVCSHCEKIEITSCDWCGRSIRPIPNHEDGWGFPPAIGIKINIGGKETVACLSCTLAFYTKCDKCSIMFDTEDTVVVENLHLCKSCAKDTPTCFACNKPVPYSSNLIGAADYKLESPSVFMCNSCSKKSIREYTFKPSPIFYATPEEKQMCIGENDTLYLGIELEVNMGKNVSSPNIGALLMQNTTSGFVYCKNDSSIRPGFEICSHPATINFHIHSDSPWRSMLPTLLLWKLRSWDALKGNTTIAMCGVHVHVNRTYFVGHTGLPAISKMVHNSRPIISLLSGRDNDEFAAYGKACDSRSYNEWIASNGNRHEVINFSNPTTVEFRPFRGTLKVSTLLGYICFVDLLCRAGRDLKFENVKKPVTMLHNILRSQEAITGYGGILKTFLSDKLGEKYIAEGLISVSDPIHRTNA